LSFSDHTFLDNICMTPLQKGSATLLKTVKI
jgi:hypothetical protein